MTKEEQDAYFAKREQKLLDRCRIKTKEQFLDECKKAGIKKDWYAFTCDRSKPVSIDDDTVYYGKSGKTIVAYPFHRWDIAFRELTAYKEESEWEATGAPYRITSVKWESNANITAAFGTTMTLREYRFSEQPEQEMLDDGWIYDHYDRYMGYSVYHKNESTGSVMRNASIVFRFTKRTDKRDADTFGFAEGSYLCGTYRYPVPQDLRTRIRSERDFPVRISDELCQTLTERLAKNLIEDEFEDLRAIQEDKRNALSAAFDPKLSEREQKDAFARASNNAEAGHPAANNYEDSRCYIVSHNNLRRAYDRAGLKW
ncbi:MAG: hypothetical protein K6D98_01275 [Clostridiales bacterium]|nr:hypothetical protein [Clostridiales bacterium]